MMTAKQTFEITREMETLFYACKHHDPNRFCEEECPQRVLCDKEELFWGCGVWEESMGEDL